jgi:hypothetical protein
MRRRVLEHDVAYWAKTYLEALSQVPVRDSGAGGSAAGSGADSAGVLAEG